MMIIIIQYPLASCYVFSLLFKYSLLQFILCHLRLFSFFSARHKVAHPYKNWRRNILYKTAGLFQYVYLSPVDISCNV